jgi:hypothetical protein
LQCNRVANWIALKRRIETQDRATQFGEYAEFQATDDNKQRKRGKSGVNGRRIFDVELLTKSWHFSQITALVSTVRGLVFNRNALGIQLHQGD